MIKVLRELSPGLMLKNAKDMVESAPRAVLWGLPLAEAEAARGRLASAGALVGIE